MRIKIHPVTICCLVVVGGVLLWLNLQTPAWVGEWYNTDRLPEGRDPLTAFLFFRGWPFTPCAYATGELSRWDPPEADQWAAFADAFLFVLALAITGMGCEWACRRWRQ